MFLCFNEKQTYHLALLSFIKTGTLCKMMAQKLPGPLGERFIESITKKIALGR